MATKAAVPLINLIPPVAQRSRSWRGEFVTSDTSGVDGLLICAGLRDRGFDDEADVADHWIYTLSERWARRIIGFEPSTDRLTVSAGTAFQLPSNERFWLFADSPHTFAEALAHQLAQRPSLYAIDNDFVVTLTDEEEAEISEQSQKLDAFSNWDLSSPTRGAWRRFQNHIELWMAGVDRVLEVRVGAPIQGSTFNGNDSTQAFDYLVPAQDWNWDRGASTLRLSGYLWTYTVMITAELESLRSDQLLALKLENAADLSIGASRAAGDVYGNGLSNQQIAALVDLTTAAWLANQLPSLTGVENLETKRHETHLRDRARELSPVPDPVFKVQ